MKHIPIDQCKDGFLYIIKARNANLGIFDEKKKSFIISRMKFKSNFLDEELHWDEKDDSFIKVFGRPMLGTAKPLNELELVTNLNDIAKLRYLNDMQIEFETEIKVLLKQFSLTEEADML
jgi:hypothetical protein